jgi:ABC-2 type transport system permease protein
MLFVSIFLVIDAVHMTVFASNLWQLPALINTGDLDQYLTRPVATLFFVSLREFAASSAINLVMALGIMGWALAQNPQVLTPLGLATLAGATLVGALLHYCICIVFVVPTFWTHAGRTYSMLSSLFLRFIERPDRIYTGIGRVLLTLILPLGLVASFPARLALFGPDPWLLAHFLGVTAVFALVALGFWRLGVRNYSSASS